VWQQSPSRWLARSVKTNGIGEITAMTFGYRVTTRSNKLYDGAFVVLH